MAAPRPTASTVKEFIECSVCGTAYTEEILYKCIKPHCPKYGNVYCEDCGRCAHKKLERDHAFDVNASYIETVAVDDTLKAMKKGQLRLKGALGHQHESNVVAHRQNAVAAVLSGMNVYDCWWRLIDFAVEASPGLTVGEFTDTAFEAANWGAEGAAVGAVIMFGTEVIYHTLRYINGDIASFKEYGYHVFKGASSAIGMGIGNWTGGGLGAALGSVFGPLGAVIGGIIGGIAGGVVGAHAGRETFDQTFKHLFDIDEEQHIRARLIERALLLFGYAGADDMDNEDIFNVNEIKKRYKDLARRYHPDKNENTPESVAKMQTINASLGCLLSVLRSKDRRTVIKRVQEIQKAIQW